MRSIEVEAQRLDIGHRVHVVVERGLRHTHFYFRSPVSDVRSRRWSRIDVKNVTDIIGKAPNVFQVIALLDGYAFYGYRKISKERGNHHRNHSEHRILRDDQGYTRFRWHGGKRNAAEIDQ